MNSYFNGSPWNFNHSLSKGFKEREPFICPIFIIEKNNIKNLNEITDYIEKISNSCWTLSGSEISGPNKTHIEAFCQHRSTLSQNGFFKEDYYLIPVGLIKNNKNTPPELYFSFFDGISSFQNAINKEKNDEILGKLFPFIQSLYDYIYIPSEINFQEYTKIHADTTQALLGTQLETIVKNLIHQQSVHEINKKLNKYLDDLSGKLEKYEYKKPSKKQNLVNQSHLTQKVIEAFFDSKILHYKNPIDNSTTPVGDLSSGEKRQALLDIAKTFLMERKESAIENNFQIIFAIDEPEISLHISACFEQFTKIRTISSFGIQSIITTHWYGFMPIISDGIAVYFHKLDSHPISINLKCFRDDIKRIKTTTKGALPTDLELKGINDLVQSIIASITGNDYKWLICEDASDKIYLDHYLSETGIIVVPVGGSPSVKKIYNYLQLALEDVRDNIQGRVYCLLDTDQKFELFEPKEGITQLSIRRLKTNIDTNKIDLLKTSDNSAFPPTVIEDALNAFHFIETLKSFNNPEIGKIPLEIDVSKNNFPSTLALNLRPTDKNILDNFFKEDGIKVKFALQYIKISDNGETPNWINEIKKFFFPSIRKQNESKNR